MSDENLKFDTISLKEPTDLDEVDEFFGVPDDAIIKVDARQEHEAVLSLREVIVATIRRISEL